MAQIYIASCAADGGLYKALLNENGKLEVIEKNPFPMPMYMVKEDGKMYILLREPMENDKNSYLAVCEIPSDGPLKEIGERVSTQGVVGCHLCTLEGEVFAVNYLSGNVIKMPSTVDTHKGKSVHETRQTEPHTHFVCPSPDKETICVTDLGTDKIYFYDTDLTLKFTFSALPGAGPRHLIFGEGTLYCVNELDNTVCVYSYNENGVEFKNRYSTLPSDFNEYNLAAAIRIDGEYLYISNRGHNSVAKYKIDGYELGAPQFFDVHGDWARDFDIFGEYIVITNERSNNVTVINKHSGILTDSVTIDAPLCVIEK